jgi:hypothetical protein
MQEVLYLLGFWKPFLSIRATLSCQLEQLVFAPRPDQISSSRDETFEPSRRAAPPRQARPRQLDHVVSGGEISGNAIGKLGENIGRNAKRRL